MDALTHLVHQGKWISFSINAKPRFSSLILEYFDVFRVYFITTKSNEFLAMVHP